MAGSPIRGFPLAMAVPTVAPLLVHLEPVFDESATGLSEGLMPCGS